MMLLLLLLVAGTSSSEAATFLKPVSGDDITVSSPVSDDVYAAGAQIVVNEEVLGDAFLAGQSIEINSFIAQDVAAAGERVTVNAPIGDDAYLAGNVVTVEQAVQGDTFAAGQRIRIAETAIIKESAYLAGQSIEIAGIVRGSVRAAGESTVIKNGARIEGDLMTYGGRPVVEEGATVVGETRHTAAKQQPSPGRVILAGWVRSIVTLFLIALLLLYGAPRFTKDVLASVSAEPGRTILTGALWFVLVLPASIILFMTVVGIPFGIALLLLTPVLYLVGSGYAALLTGRFLFSRLGRGGETEGQGAWPQALLGAAIYETAQLLPLIGFIATFIVILFTAGSVLRVADSRIRGSTS